MKNNTSAQEIITIDSILSSSKTSSSNRTSSSSRTSFISKYQINHKVSEKELERFKCNTKAILNENSTLKDIKGMVSSTKGFNRAPGPKALRCCGDVVAAITTGGCRIEVYRDGFAVYQTPYRAVVIRMDYVGNVYYEGDPGLERAKQYIDLSDEQWAIAVMMSAETKLERLNQIRDEEWLVSLLDAGEVDEETDEKVEMEINAGVDVEKSIVDKDEDERLWAEVETILTKHQNDIVRLFYKECLTHSEIADLMSIERAVVSVQLKRIKNKIKKVLEKNF